MAYGTRSGGLKTAAKLRKKYGTTPDGRSAFHVIIGSKGGKAPKTTPSGFKAMDREKVQEAGRKGGAAGRRRPARQAVKLYEQSDTQLATLSAKHGSRRPW